MNTREAAKQWADVWERGWRDHDAQAIEALYAEDALWRQHPFRDPEPGYVTRVFDEEASAVCEFGVPIVDGDSAAVPWSARTTLLDDEPVPVETQQRDTDEVLRATVDQRRPCTPRHRRAVAVDDRDTELADR